MNWTLSILEDSVETTEENGELVPRTIETVLQGTTTVRLSRFEEVVVTVDFPTSRGTPTDERNSGGKFIYRVCF